MTANRDELLSHDADGIREFDNALPRWWLYGFYFTIAFAVVYYVNYHVLPKPVVGQPTAAAEYALDMKQAALEAAKRPSPFAGGPVAPRKDAASLAKGREIFTSQTNACFSCHRPDLGGLVGPNLTDNNWIHGCTPAEILHNVSTGFPDKGMMPFGTGAHLDDEQVLDVVSYVISMRGSNPPNPKPIDPARDKPCS